MKAIDETTTVSTRQLIAHPVIKPSTSTQKIARSALRWMLAICVALCADSVTIHAQTWETVDDFPGSTANAITTDSAGNIFISGSTKNAANQPTAVVLKSSDGGQTWDNDPSTPGVDEPSDALSVTDGSFASFGAIAARRVTANGVTFEDHVVSAGKAGQVLGGPTNPLTGTLTSPWLVRRSVDGGATWETLDQFIHPTYNLLPTYCRPYGVAIAPNGIIYVVGSAQQSITTTAKGKTTTTYVNHWLIRRGAPGAGGSLQWSTFDFAFPVSSENDRVNTVFPSAVTCVANRVFVAGGGGNSWHVLQSIDDGLSWTVADNFRLGTTGNSHAHSIAADSQGHLYVAGSGERVTTTGSGKNSVSVFERFWLVRKGSPEGTNWSTIEQLANPAGTATASGITVDPYGDVHVTGSVQTGAGNARWITRQRSAATGTWTTTEDFSLASTRGATGRAITADSIGNLFAVGGASDSAGVSHDWLVRRDSSAARSDAWLQQLAGGTGSPRSRVYYSNVWTDTEVIVWGGILGETTGDRYNLATNTWTPVSTVGAPSGRYYHTAVWTGTEMIVWGGIGNLNTGARYNPVTDTWTQVSTVGAPAGRRNHSAVWTGTEMIIWGGNAINSNVGGRYNPATDTWRTMSAIGAPAGFEDVPAVWTGSEMIVWSGSVGSKSGGRYNPVTDTWVATSTTGAPLARNTNSAVWTGSEMIIWGGNNVGPLGDGGRYDPVTDSWTEVMSVAGAPAPRRWHSAVWTGTEMFVWGGYDGVTDLNTGSRYNPTTDQWMPVTTVGAPNPTEKRMHSTVWTGSELIHWGVMSGDHRFIYRYISD